MVKQKSSSDTTLEGIKKALDKLTIIELIKSGATRTQVRSIVGSMSNETFAAIYKALKKTSIQKESDEQNG